MIKHISARFTVTSSFVLAALGVTPIAHAQLGGLSVPSIGGSKSSAAAVDVGALLSDQKGLMNRFNSAMNNMLLAQAKTLGALGQQSKADEMAAVAESFGTGNVQDKDQVTRAVKLTKEASDTIAAENAKKAQVSEEGKGMMTAAVPHYVKGLSDGAGLPKEFEKWAAAAQGGLGSLGPMDAVKLKGGLGEAMTVITNLPELVKAWGGTTSAFVSYAKGNKIDVSGVESKLGTL